MLNGGFGTSREWLGGVESKIGTRERVQTRNPGSVLGAFRLGLKAVFALEKAVSAEWNPVVLFLGALEVSVRPGAQVAIHFGDDRFLRSDGEGKRERAVDRGFGKLG